MNAFPNIYICRLILRIFRIKREYITDLQICFRTKKPKPQNFRDLAARNCLVDTSTLRCRLADAALSRDLFPQDYHCLGDNENRAIGWMALETLQHGQYSTATDTVSALL